MTVIELFRFFGQLRAVVGTLQFARTQLRVSPLGLFACRVSAGATTSCERGALIPF
jgi:hypothetical protein